MEVVEGHYAQFMHNECVVLVVLLKLLQYTPDLVNYPGLLTQLMMTILLLSQSKITADLVKYSDTVNLVL